nr:Predicted membrane protein [Streptococcus thermophilus]
MEMLKGDIVGVAVLITVVLIVLIAIAVPLRNYYNGREEIARLEASIETKQRQKADLEEQIDRYNDPAYLEQEARRRLGMMAPGETAWRIIDPRMRSDAITTSRHGEIAPDTPWHTVIWDSLREIPEAEEPRAEDAPEFPDPEEPPAPAPSEQPAPAEPPAEPAEAPVEQ